MKKIDLCAYSFQKRVYKECILMKLNVCILLRKKKRFLVNIWRLGKKINRELIYSKKYLTAKKIFSSKESFICFYRKVIPVSVTLIDSVYIKDENYYPKAFLCIILY